MKLKALIEKREDLKSEMQELLIKAEKEQRALTNEEIEKFDNAEKEIKNIDETLQREEQKNKMENKVNEDLTLEQRESKEFVSYVRGMLENRSDVNLATGTNGAIIPKTIANKIIKKAFDMSTILTDATKYNTKGALTIPVYTETSSNKINMAYADEFVELESKTGNFASVDLGNFLCGALVKVSKSLVANTDIDLENTIVNLVAEAVAQFEEKECLYGTDSKVQGLRGVTKGITTASATAITGAELIKLKNSVKKQFRANAKWIMSNETLTAIETLTDQDGKFLFHEDMTGEHNGYLLGYPVEVSDNMNDIGASKVVIYFGDFSGLALKQRDDALELNVLRERFATQHAIGVNAWLEFDAKVEDGNKIAKLTMKAS